MSRSATLSPDLQSGKAATKALVRAFGGQEAAAEETGYRQQRISDFGLPNVAEFAPLDFVALLEERTEGTAGWPHVTRWLARRTGHALVRLPQGGIDENGLRDSVMIITRELGDTAAALTEALNPDSPGGVTVTPEEARSVLTELDQMLEAAAALRVTLEQLATGDAQG